MNLGHSLDSNSTDSGSRFLTLWGEIEYPFCYEAIFRPNFSTSSITSSTFIVRTTPFSTTTLPSMITSLTSPPLTSGGAISRR